MGHNPGFGNNPSPPNRAGFGNNPHPVQTPPPGAPATVVAPPAAPPAPPKPTPAPKSSPGFGGKPSVKYRKATEAEAKKNKELTDKMLKWADKADARLKLQSDVLIPFIHTRGATFLDEWLMQSISAKGDASAPPEEESDTFWLLALAGNLLWAASCFVPGAGVVNAIKSIGGEAIQGMTTLGKGMYATLQMGGAMVAAGAIEHIARDTEGKRSGKDIIAEILNTKRKQMGDELRRNAASWADKLVRLPGMSADDYVANPSGYLTNVEQILWTGLFPAVGFEGFTDIYQRALNNISEALGQFNKQYDEWQRAIKNWAEHDVTGHYGTPMDGGVAYQQRMKFYQMTRPFKPQLTFKG